MFAIIYQLWNFGIMFVIAGIVGAICSVLISILFIPKTQFRTKLGGELYAKIVGFKEFIVTSEKDRLEELCYENPSYFYDILPYAYVLGVSSVWINKFEDIAIPTVDWYVGRSSRIISLSVFNSICTKMTRSSTPPSSSGGSGSSGGGSSGGGSGGGGGGRW